MQLVVLAVHGSDTEKYLLGDGWVATPLPTLKNGDWHTLTKQVHGHSTHSLQANELTSDSPQSTFT